MRRQCACHVGRPSRGHAGWHAAGRTNSAIQGLPFAHAGVEARRWPTRRGPRKLEPCIVGGGAFSEGRGTASGTALVQGGGGQAAFPAPSRSEAAKRPGGVREELVFAATSRPAEAYGSHERAPARGPGAKGDREGKCTPGSNCVRPPARAHPPLVGGPSHPVHRLALALRIDVGGLSKIGPCVLHHLGVRAGVHRLMGTTGPAGISAGARPHVGERYRLNFEPVEYTRVSVRPVRIRSVAVWQAEMEAHQPQAAPDPDWNVQARTSARPKGVQCTIAVETPPP